MAKTVTTSFSEPALTDAMITGNYSTLTINIYFSANNSDTYFNNRTLSCSCNGSTQTATVSHPKKGSVSQSFTFTNIEHNSDGTKSVSWSWNITTGTSVLGNLSESDTKALQTIPRATTPTLQSTSINLGSTVTINTPSLSNSFTHTLTYSIGSLSGTIATGVTTSYTWNKPPDGSTQELSPSLATAFPNAKSGAVTITCKTYNGSTLIGTKTCTLTVNTQNNATYQPSIQLTATASKQFDSKYLNTVSGITVSATTAGKFGSTISSVSITAGSKTSASNSLTVNPISLSMSSATQNVAITGTTTDSRGYRGDDSIQNGITVYRYNSPQIVQADTSVVRCDENGSPSNSGTYVLVSLKYTYQNDGYPNSLNTPYITIGGTPYELNTSTNETTSNGVVTGTSTTKIPTSGSGIFAVNSHYDWTITCQDAVQQGLSLGTITYSGTIQTSSRIINVRPRWFRNSIW